VIGAAITVVKIATGEVVEVEVKPSAAAELGRKGGRARAVGLSAKRRLEIARKAAAKVCQLG
jgi:hypothetical protein